MDQAAWVKKMVFGLGVVFVSILVLYTGCLRKRLVCLLVLGSEDKNVFQ